MTETQVFTVAISLGVSFIAVLTGVLLNNGRLGDIKDLLDARIEAARASNGRDIASLRTEMAELRALIERNHSELLVRIAEIESRRLHP